MSVRITQLAVLTLAWLAADLHARAPVTAPPLRRYPEIKTEFNQSLSRALTNEQRLELYRQTVAQGRYSGRPMLIRMFGNFQPGSFNLSTTTAGLSTTVRLLASDNKNVVKGHARALRYAMNIQDDSRFKVVGLNQQRINSAGRTDADIVFRHKLTGLQVRMEVKNMSLASQRANLKDIQSQILKMAQDARTTGEMQVWVNRQDVVPEVRTFAERHGVKIQERLRTGKASRRLGDCSFEDFANGRDKDLRIQAKFTAVSGGVQAGIGAYFVYQSLRQLDGDLSSFSGTHSDWLRIGEHGSGLLAGGGFVAAGVAQLARQIPTLTNSVRLVSVTRWGGWRCSRRLGRSRGRRVGRGDHRFCFWASRHWDRRCHRRNYWRH